MASKALKLAVALLTCVSVGLPLSLAEARPRWGHWGSGWHAGYGPGWGYGARPFYASSFYGYPRYHGGYYPAYSGGYYPGYYYGGPVYYRRRSNSVAALAAGLIGGVALGAILASASRQRVYRTHSYAPRYHRR